MANLGEWCGGGLFDALKDEQLASDVAGPTQGKKKKLSRKGKSEEGRWRNK